MRRCTRPPQEDRSWGGPLVRLLTLVVVLGLVAAACADDGEVTDPADPADDPAADDPEPADDGDPLRVALITPGPLTDEGYNYSAALGMEMAEEQFGIETSISENTPIAENAQVIRGYAADGFDVIIGHGEHNGEPMLQVAEEFPDVIYFVHMGDVDGHPSVVSSYPRFEESAYLQGLVAAHLSEEKHIGFVGFTPLAVIVRSMNAALEAAQTVDPDFQMSHVFTDDLVDPATAREATNAVIGNGADVIMHINGGANSTAIIQAAVDADIPVMGFPVDQNAVAPDHVATSLLASYPLLVVQQIESVSDGTVQGGQIVEYGLDTGVVDIAELPDWVPDEARQAVEEAREAILSGELVVDVSATLD